MRSHLRGGWCWDQLQLCRACQWLPLLQEIHIRQGVPTAFYLDSASTVFVATDDTAIKKSVWLIRRACVLEDGVVHDEIEPLHITERDMAADILTKYLVFAVWTRHVHYSSGWVLRTHTF